MTDATTQHDWSPRVMELLAEQQRLYASLDAMSRDQSRLIENDDSDGLLELLARRQRVIDQLLASLEAFEPYRRDWGDRLDRLDEQTRSELRRRLDLLTEMAGRITRRDEEDQRVLALRREAIADELADVHRGRNALAGYAQQDRSARFQDREA